MGAGSIRSCSVSVKDKVKPRFHVFLYSVLRHSQVLKAMKPKFHNKMYRSSPARGLHDKGLRDGNT